MVTQHSQLLRLLAAMLLAAGLLGCATSEPKPASRAADLYLLVEHADGIYQIGNQTIPAGDAAALGAALSAYPTQKLLLKGVRLGDLLQVMALLSDGDYQVFFIGENGAINRATFTR